MTLSRRQKQLATVLAVAVILLVLDRMLIGDEALDPTDGSATASAEQNSGWPSGAGVPLPGSPVSSGNVATAPPGTAATGARTTIRPTSALSARGRPVPGGAAGWGAPGIADRLSGFVSRSPGLFTSRNPFQLPGAAAAKAQSTDAATDDNTLRLRAAEAFVTRHRIRAIVGAGRGGMVLVSDRLVRLGEGLDGWKLTHIARDSATFEQDGLRVTLSLSDAHPQPTATLP